MERLGVRGACVGAIVLAIAGVFGTWSTAGPATLDGFEGPHNGWIVIVFGLIALAGVGAVARGSWLGIVLVLGCAAAMLYVALEAVTGDTLGGASGWGVWLTIVASGGLAAVALAAAVQRSTGSTRAAPRTNP